MKHTTSRKKMLLSSVAMLLVAMLALGSATFAWFAANPRAKANGIKMKTTASTGLVVRTETDSFWSHNATLRSTGDSTSSVKASTNTNAFNLTPVSQNQQTPSSFVTYDAASASEYDADSTKDPGTATAGTDYYTEKIYCRLSDGSNTTEGAAKKVYLTGVTITAAAGATMQNAIKVAITGADGSLLGTYQISGQSGNHGTITAKDDLASPKAFDPAVSAIATDLDIDTGLTNLTASGEDLSKYVTVYAYLDGQHTDCYSDKVGTVNATEIISGIEVNLELK